MNGLTKDATGPIGVVSFGVIDACSCNVRLGEGLGMGGNANPGPGRDPARGTAEDLGD
jgi:hypothetical protein